MNSDAEQIISVVVGDMVGTIGEKAISKYIVDRKNRNIARGTIAALGLGTGIMKATGKGPASRIDQNLALFATALGSGAGIEYAAGADAVIFKWMDSTETNTYSGMRPGELVNISPERYTNQINTLKSQVQNLSKENTVLRTQSGAKPSSAAGLSAAQMEAEMGFI